MLSNHISLNPSDLDNQMGTLTTLGALTIFCKPEIANHIKKEGKLIYSLMFKAQEILMLDLMDSAIKEEGKDIYSALLCYSDSSDLGAYKIIKELCLSSNNVLNNPVIKKEIMQDIIANDLDMMNISEEFILERLLFLPNTRKIFIEMFLEKFEEEFSGDKIKNIPNSYKKVILASLVEMCIVGNDIDPSAFEFVKRIANIFDIEEEYLDEFVEPVKSIHFAKLELNELINE